MTGLAGGRLDRPMARSVRSGGRVPALIIAQKVAFFASRPQLRGAPDAPGWAAQSTPWFGILEKGSLLVGKGKAWLLIAAGTLTGLVAGTGLGRYVLNIPTTPAGSAGPAAQDNAANNVSCFDTSEH